MGGLGGVASGGATAGMGGNHLPFVRDLYGPLGDAQGDFLVDQGVRRRVEVLVVFDVVIDVDPAGLQAGEFIGCRRQGLQGRAIDRFVQLPAGLLQVLHRAAVEFLQQLADGPVQVDQIEKGLVAQPGQDPTLHDLHANFRFGFIPRTADSGRDDGKAVVLGQLLVAGVQVWLVSAGMLYPAFQVIGHHHQRHPIDESQGPHVTPNPVLEFLAGLGLSVRVTTGSHVNSGIKSPQNRGRNVHFLLGKMSSEFL